MIEVLETVKSIEAKKEKPTAEKISKELKLPASEVNEIMEKGVKDGYLAQRDGAFKITQKGIKIVKEHQQKYVHEKMHQIGLIGRITRFLEGKVINWKKHWRERHGLDNHSLQKFYNAIDSLKGRIEETSTIADLDTGEEGKVTFIVGGRGLIRRLSEMGLTPGTKVKIVRNAPFHGPIEIKVRGVSLALGYGVATKVFIKKVKEAN